VNGLMGGWEDGKMGGYGAVSSSTHFLIYPSTIL